MNIKMNRRKFFDGICLLLFLMWSAVISAHTERMTVEGHHGQLAVTIDRPDAIDGKRKLPLLVLCHGFGANQHSRLFDALADSLCRRGIAVLRFDFNGHGQSEGRFENMTVGSEIADARCILRYASALPWVGRIALAGHSQGGVVAAMTAGQLSARREKDIKRLAALVLMAPAAVLRDDALRGNTFGATYRPENPPEYIQLPGGRRLGGAYIREAVRLPIYETALHYQGPACILHGEADRIVPYTYGQRFHYLIRKSEWRLLPHADHGFKGQECEVAHWVGTFLSRLFF